MTTKALTWTAASTLVPSLVLAQGVKREHLNPPALATPSGYTHVVTASGGKLVLVSGQVSLDREGTVVGKGDLKAQTRQVYANLKAALAAAGAQPKDVLKMTTFVVGYRPEMLPVLREVRSGFFGTEAPPPASTLVGVQALAREDFLIEVEAVAAVP
jgi:enamine deaminase RidA (YjgF/YER057c/UK114 family)